MERPCCLFYFICLLVWRAHLLFLRTKCSSHFLLSNCSLFAVSLSLSHAVCVQCELFSPHVPACPLWCKPSPLSQQNDRKLAHSFATIGTSFKQAQGSLHHTCIALWVVKELPIFTPFCQRQGFMCFVTLSGMCIIHVCCVLALKLPSRLQ